MRRLNSGLDHMMADIDHQFALTACTTGLPELSARVRAALEATPRDRFTPEPVRPMAYADSPQPIGHGQTISQPFIVALMTELLAVQDTDTILEIGTGSGYQAAVLARLGATVYSVEIIPELARRATTLLARVGCDQVRVLIGNGAHGYPAAAPFDKIIITAAAAEVPHALLEQLRPGGLIVAPLGPVAGPQQLSVLRKSHKGAITSEPVLAVNFVPFTHC